MKQVTNVVSIHPYFRVKPGQLAAAKAMLPRFIAASSSEKLLLHYDFTCQGDLIFCREMYSGAEGLLAHLTNVREPLAEMLKLVDLERLEIHGPADELEKLKGPLSDLNPAWFVYECGVSR